MYIALDVRPILAAIIGFHFVQGFAKQSNHLGGGGAGWQFLFEQMKVCNITILFPAFGYSSDIGLPPGRFFGTAIVIGMNFVSVPARRKHKATRRNAKLPGYSHLFSWRTSCMGVFKNGVF
jgi:hypothetical protein